MSYYKKTFKLSYYINSKFLTPNYIRQGFDKNLTPHTAYGRKSYRI